MYTFLLKLYLSLSIFSTVPIYIPWGVDWPRPLVRTTSPSFISVVLSMSDAFINPVFLLYPFNIA